VTFGNNKKSRVLGIGIIKINDHFTLNDDALVNKLWYNLLSVSQFIDADWMCFFANLILVFLTPLAILFVAFLALVRFLG
jgi:hypothetical protein